jgi:tetratricopeptide (TPR) repeat protein
MTVRSPSSPLVAIALAISVMFTAGFDLLSSPDEDIEKGNELYAEGDYEGALESYRAAADSADDPAIQYDIGAALYKLAEGADSETRKAALDQAEEAFRKATEARDDKLQASAHYNLGNTLYQKEKFEEAIESYKKSLRANPEADDVRYNLELAQRKLHKDDQQQQGGQGQPQQGQGNGQDKDQQDQQQQGGGQGDQGQDQQDKDQQNQGQGNGQGDPDQQDQNNTQGGDGDQDKDQNKDPKDKNQNNGGGQDQDKDKDGDNDADKNKDGQGDKDKDKDKDSDKDGDADKDKNGDANTGKRPRPNGRPSPDGDSGEEPRDEEKSEIDRKLDALERMSRDLRRDRMRKSGGSSGDWRGKPKKDW